LRAHRPQRGAPSGTCGCLAGLTAADLSGATRDTRPSGGWGHRQTAAEAEHRCQLCRKISVQGEVKSKHSSRTFTIDRTMAEVLTNWMGRQLLEAAE